MPKLHKSKFQQPPQPFIFSPVKMVPGEETKKENQNIRYEGGTVSGLGLDSSNMFYVSMTVFVFSDETSTPRAVTESGGYGLYSLLGGQDNTQNVT